MSRQIAEPGSEVEIVVKGEPHTHLHIMVASDVLPFEPKELDRQKLIVRKSNLKTSFNVKEYFKIFAKNY